VAGRRASSPAGTATSQAPYASARRLFDPADPAYHPVVARWLIADLAEAALHTDRVAEGQELLVRLEAAAGARPAVWIELNLRHARALLASDDDEAERRFDEALAADLTRWPFQRARLLLAHGEWLRRRRRIADSRAPLRAARDSFDTLGCMSWGDRARGLAAQGLSNREIGQPLYLSHRTVGTHLYRIFPKLGITARGDLQAALSAPPSRK
jgi:hypothetical protein